MTWLETDWPGLFVPEMSLPEILIRGTAVYLALVLLLRVVLKRQAGKVSLSDLLVVSLVAGVSRNPLVRDTKSITDGLLIVLIVLLWSYALDWLSYHLPLLRKLLHPQATVLVHDGRIRMENLHKELMTEDQLQSKLRMAGVSDVSEVAEARMEADGHVSVILRPKSGFTARRSETDGKRKASRKAQR